MSTKTLVESRMKALEESKGRLVQAWSPYIDAVGKALQEKYGRTLTNMDKQNIAQCLENSLVESAGRSKIFENTTSDNISFLGIQLPVISALLPSLVLNELATVQALDRRNGSIFFMDLKYGQDKGSITSGTSMLNAKTGHNQTAGGRTYAASTVTGEALTATGTQTVAYFPVIDNGTAVLTSAGVVVGRAAVGGAFTMTVSGATASINPTTGVLTANSTTYSLPTLKITYMYNYQTTAVAQGGVPQVDFALTGELITAQDFSLRTNYTLGAAIDLEKAHGLNLEDEMIKYLGGEIKFELDHYGIDMMYNTAVGTQYDAEGHLLVPATTAGNWDATVSAGAEWLWKKFSFLDKMEFASNNIFAATLRGVGTHIVCGNNVARVIRQMTEHFKPAAQDVNPTGPMKIGTLSGRPVIQDPLLPTNSYFMLYKGDSILKSSFIYAPYIPLFATNTLVTADLKAQKGFLSSSGFKVTNAGFYCAGTISNLGVGY